MELTKDIWNKEDIEEFNNYLYSIRNDDKIEWTRNIINTNYDVLAIKSDVISSIAKSITKGNYIEFLENCNFKYHEVFIVYDKVLAKIKEVDIFIKYLERLFDIFDNWASVDCIDFSIVNKNRELFFNKVNLYINDERTFVKRVGIRILFKYLNDEYISKVIEIINSIDMNEYYVSMGVAWLLCEAMIKCRDYIIDNINDIKVDNETFNRFVGKCNDSFRISSSDKMYLRRLKNER